MERPGIEHGEFESVRNTVQRSGAARNRVSVDVARAAGRFSWGLPTPPWRLACAPEHVNSFEKPCRRFLYLKLRTRISPAAAA